jgi:hypothetical protein
MCGITRRCDGRMNGLSPQEKQFHNSIKRILAHSPFSKWTSAYFLNASARAIWRLPEKDEDAALRAMYVSSRTIFHKPYLGSIECQECTRRRKDRGKGQKEKGEKYALPLNLPRCTLRLLFKTLLDSSFCGHDNLRILGARCWTLPVRLR